MAAPIIVVMGPPGAGKGTQSELLARKLGYVHVSTGELVRASDNADILAQANRGELIDSVAMEILLTAKLASLSADQGIILDGFPRLEPEYDWLEQMLPKWGRQITRVVFISIEQSEAFERNAARGRTDDRPEAQAERWREYHHDTEPVVARYRQAGLLTEVDGNGAVEAVATRVEGAL